MMDKMLKDRAKIHKINVTMVSGLRMLSIALSCPSKIGMKEELKPRLELYPDKFLHRRKTYLRLLPLYADLPSSHSHSNMASIMISFCFAVLHVRVSWGRSRPSFLGKITSEFPQENHCPMCPSSFFSKRFKPKLIQS